MFYLPIVSIMYLQSSNLNDDGMGQLMSSVTVPIFDRRNHTVSV